MDQSVECCVEVAVWCGVVWWCTTSISFLQIMIYFATDPLGRLGLTSPKCREFMQAGTPLISEGVNSFPTSKLPCRFTLEKKDGRLAGWND